MVSDVKLVEQIADLMSDSSDFAKQVKNEMKAHFINKLSARKLPVADDPRAPLSS